ncbi:MAG: branched-chain amino acid ABC transporter permease [Acidimicrobiales bacterium]
MTQFLILLFNGLSLGAIYALVALGFVIIFKASEVLNFAHGSLLLLGAYVVARLEPQIGFFPAVAVGLGAAALAALIVQRAIIAPLRGAPVISLAIITIGVDILLFTQLNRLIGADILSLNQPWGGKSVTIGSVGITQNRAVAMVVATVVIALFFAAFKYTNWGVAMRASAEDGEAAALMGIRLGRISAVAWLIAGALAALAGVFLTGAPTPGLQPGIGAIALRAFPAAILGGLDSTGGALVGGLVIGLAESFTAGYQDKILFLGRGFGDVMPYVVMIAVLLVRPTGLFGTKELTRV